MATNRRRVSYFDGFMLKMNVIYAGAVFVGLLLAVITHSAATGHGCDTVAYELKFRMLVISEIVTILLFFSSVLVGAMTMLMTNLKGPKSAEAQVGMVVEDGNGVPQSPRFPKGEVVSVALTMVAYISFMSVGYFQYKYQVARVSCASD